VEYGVTGHLGRRSARRYTLTMIQFLVALLAGAAAYMAATFGTRLVTGGMADAGNPTTVSVAIGVSAAVITTWMMWRGGQRWAGGVPRLLLILGLLAASAALWLTLRPR